MSLPVFPATLVRCLPALFLLFILGVLPVRAAEAFRLHQLVVSRFETHPAGGGNVWEARVLFTELNGTTVQGYAAPIPADRVPVEALDKLLLSSPALQAYFWLSDSALDNFEILFDQRVTIEGVHYYPVRLAEELKLSYGRPLNLSTRGLVEPGRPLIGGFVVEGPARWFLIRALGPGLRAAGVPDAILDPYLTLYKGSTGLYYNDDWATRHDADAMEATSARVGASPLSRTGKEGALLVELTPGNYSVHVQSASQQERGEAMFEIFVVDEL